MARLFCPFCSCMALVSPDLRPSTCQFREVLSPPILLSAASLITVSTLVLASERDFWSRPEDHQALIEDLVHSRKVRAVVIPGATHFVHLDRAERGRSRLLNEIGGFLTE